MPTSSFRLDPTVWGPHFWFFLHTIAMTYPIRPNDVTRKKYYEFICSLPIFIPIEAMGSDFSKLLDEYPVTAYLDSRDAFVRWIHFIHNKINEKLEKPKISMKTPKNLIRKNLIIRKTTTKIMYMNRMKTKS